MGWARCPSRVYKFRCLVSYEDLASEYDNSRFDNSYGRYIDCQEREILSRWLGNAQTQSILDLACGTGRFLSFATAGLDLSPRMIEVAKTKHPDKEFIQASASNIPIESGQYDVVFSLHLFMHLSQTKIKAIWIKTPSYSKDTI